MKVVDQETGKEFRLQFNDEIKEAIKTHNNKWKCTHERTELRTVIVDGGAKQIRQQCLKCGQKIGQAIKRSKDQSQPESEYTQLAENWHKAKETEYELLFQDFIIRQKKSNFDFDIKYDEYRKSPEWAARRDLVLRRANFICEACLTNKATEVHHKNYNHVFNEVLFDLVAVCKDCHAKLHHKEADLEENVFSDKICYHCRWNGGEDLDPICLIFGIHIDEALAENGPCGPEHKGYENLK